ncbi:Periplasmic thiol:disulfide interchange protein DsbA [hydrothermal vent metagenome]|uniref:Thiol:disulfide interchange protein DsbA n=1 Tax=hydrothermal vent metagenome TaxID=652676 RepID=A0A3B1AJ51_9ZZZZ
MKLSSHKIVILFASLALLGASVSSSFAARYQEGEHYERVSPPQPTTAAPGQVEVVELFWYGCPHCYRLEPYAKRWLKKKPSNVKFVRMPGVFQPSWEIGARAYYTAEILGVADKVHGAMFEAIHELKSPMSSEAEILALFKQHGVEEKDFNRVFKSFAVETKLRRARDMGRRYGARGVPAIIVNGKFRTGVHEAGGNARVFQVVDYLVQQESR